MAFTFAWVDEGEPFAARNDEDVFAFDLSHLEGEFATLSIELRNPRVGLLTAGRKRWCWFGLNGTPLFKGRLTALPTNLREEIVTLSFVARPSDYITRKKAVAETMRVFPFYDPLWVAEEAREDPDIVLEARPELWHTDRITHEVTSSSLIEGEDGTIELGGDVFQDGVSIAFKGAPLRKVRVEATCQWTQLGAGRVDISKQIKKLFPADRVQSLTSKGLLDEWPEEGDKIGSGWTFGPCSCRGDANPLSMQSVLTYTRSGRWIRFFIIELLQSTTLVYDSSRTLIERITFEVTCDTQEIMSAADDEEAVTITLQTEDVDKPVDPGGLTPVRDPRRPSFFPTDRGLQSISYLVALARAELLARARAVEISFETSFENGLGLSCRKNIRIADPRLPGGEALGKVAGYSLILSGDTGQASTRVLVACTVGKGGSLSPQEAISAYVEGYVDPGYQQTSGGQIGFETGDVIYGAPEVDVDGYDGVDFFNMTPGTVIADLSLYNDLDDQRAIVNLTWPDINDVVAALARAPTQIDMTLVPLEGGPFQTDYSLAVEPVLVSKTIDLEASA
ncbi:hypothetical protein [Hyphomonas sp.]|uniref:hypothetical protein n=1 Tax=Hyphomonas sp. TaxID=87 RepID=UPI0025BA86DF|nr:hypothetical protein [Hyphomonas sp.]